MFFAGPKAGTQRKSQALAMAQSLDLHPEADLPAPSHLLASSPLEHLPPLLSSQATEFRQGQGLSSISLQAS